MKAIKILAVLALVMFVIAEVGDGIRGFRDGWNEIDEQAALKMHAPFTLNLEAEKCPCTGYLEESGGWKIAALCDGLC